MTDEPRAEHHARLATLARLVGAEVTSGSEVTDPDPLVVDVHHDHRAVTPGSLFACIRGTVHDGHEHAEAAIAAGAVALVTERQLGLGVPELRTIDTRAVLGPLAAEVHGRPADRLDVVAVTGTNGKTTVTHLVTSIARAAGRSARTIGSLSGVRTTPEATDLHRQLAGLAADGVQMVALEASSHALVMGRLDGLVADVAAFTNLSRDHLDFHGTMEAYFQAKARLFEPSHARRAVVNLDDPHGRLLADAALIPTTGVSLDDAVDLVVHRDHSTFSWRGAPVRVGLVGRFNVANSLVAAAAADTLGIEVGAIAAGLAEAATVAGRFERVELGAPFDVVVDFAHTPDALAAVLQDGRDLIDPSGGRLIVVFGCGGDRDGGKRPAMGEVAGRHADLVVVTSDNPRTESPHVIADAIVAGVESDRPVFVELDRRAAIAHALDEARPGDLVIVAGKGHETEQIIGDERLPFDDRVVVAEEYRRLVGGLR